MQKEKNIPGDPSSTEEQQELKHKNQVKSAFHNYTKDILSDFQSLISAGSLNSFYQTNKERKMMMLQEALTHNQHFLNLIVDYINDIEEYHFTANPQTTPNNRSKIKTTLKQFYREWCDEGPEKEDFIRIVAVISRFLKKGDNVLVPGCGLGRLVYELVKAGFGAQGNEVTYFMLFGSNFIINAAEHKQQFKIFPFISSTYYKDEEDQFRGILIPDEAPSEEMRELEQPNFGISAGQFAQVYKERPNYFEGVATCFFLDTANNIFEYIDTIATTLKAGGVWVNFGPLLFHYRDMANQVSVEVSWQVLRVYILKAFTLMQQGMKETTYCHDIKSDMGVTYNCISFVALKKGPAS